MKKKLIFIGILLTSVLVNTLPLFIFKDSIVLSKQSSVSFVVMLLVSANGTASYFLRHKGNFLSFGKPRGSALSEDKAYTFTDEYQKAFFLQFSVYWFAIPFYLPCIFFVSEWVHLLWTLCVIFVPQVIFIAFGVFTTIKEAKDYRLLQRNQDQELREQQKREEMGRFK